MKTDLFLDKNLIYTIPKDKNNTKDLIKLLKKHPEIKFVSFVGIDLWGNDTDEKIPVSYFMKNVEDMMENGIQTDGSSVNLSSLATLSDARVDLIPDRDSVWYVDYNYENIDKTTGLPVGTLRIWSNLMHNGKYVDSRKILRNAVEQVESQVKEMISSTNSIEKVEVMLGTELEFWVRTPYDSVNVERLVLSQALKEQYWKRTKGVVRTALEQTLEILKRYDINPEMGHKEVGGVTNYISGNELVENHIVEQLEIDWRFSNALRTADNELLARIIIKEVFRLHGLEVSFHAKPIQGVAGNGEHCHFSIMATGVDGKKTNLLTATDKNAYLSNFGWGMLMGMLKHYDDVNPFISNTNDAFHRLKPGYEAPTHTVASIGSSSNSEMRNRTVLAGLVKDEQNPLSTRIELRTPNPKTNIYLAVTATLAAIMDGVEFAMQEEISNQELEKEFCKDYGVAGKYLKKDKVYRVEEDIFEKYTEEERDKYFGHNPRTVYENAMNLKADTVLERYLDISIIQAYQELIISNWMQDLKQRIIPGNRELVRSCMKLENANSYDTELWNEIQMRKEELVKDDVERKSILTQIIDSIDEKNFNQASNLQMKMNQKIEELTEWYAKYRKNMLF